jgi:hypothetical protein
VIRGAVEQFIADVPIPYGRAVARKTAGSNRLILPNVTGLKILGIAVSVDMYGMPDNNLVAGTGEPGYAAGAIINVLTWGDCWTVTEDAVTPDDPVLVVYAAAAAPQDKLGRFRKAAAAGRADAWTSARFLTAASANSLTLVNVGGS